MTADLVTENLWKAQLSIQETVRRLRAAPSKSASYRRIRKLFTRCGVISTSARTSTGLQVGVFLAFRYKLWRVPLEAERHRVPSPLRPCCTSCTIRWVSS
jgi:hypothetical protein